MLSYCGFSHAFSIVEGHWELVAVTAKTFVVYRDAPITVEQFSVLQARRAFQ